MNLAQAFDDACSRYNGENFASLNERDQVLVAIWGVEAEVNNGGFDQYYFNGAGDQALYVPTALRAIGAHRMAEIVERANTLFGTGGPPASHPQRQAALFRITEAAEAAWDTLDRAFQEYPDDIGALLVKHFGLD